MLSICKVFFFKLGFFLGYISFFLATDSLIDVAISENVKVEVIKSTGIQALVSNTETKK